MVRRDPVVAGAREQIERLRKAAQEDHVTARLRVAYARHDEEVDTRGAHAQGAVEAHPRPLLAGPQQVAAGGQRVQQRREPLRRDGEEPLVDVPDLHGVPPGYIGENSP